MNEEADVDTGLRIMEDEQVNGEKESLEKKSIKKTYNSHNDW